MRGCPNGPSGETRHHQEAIEQSLQEPAPIAAAQTVICDGDFLSVSARCQRDRTTGHTSHVMGMDDVCLTDQTEDSWCDRVSRVTPHMEPASNDVYLQPGALHPGPLLRSKKYKAAIDVRGKGSSKFQGVAFTTPEQPGRPER